MLGGQTIGEQIIREQQIWGQASELVNCGSYSLMEGSFFRTYIIHLRIHNRKFLSNG